MVSGRLSGYIQDSKSFFICYLSLPFLLFAMTNNKKVFYFYLIGTLLLTFLVCIFRIVREEGKKDYDIGILSAVKFANICTILYTPKPVWIISGLIIFTLFFSFCYRHSRIGFAEIKKHKFFFTLYTTLYLTLFFRSVQTDWLLGVYGIQLAVIFSYSVLCALKTNMFYRGILYGSASLITLVLIGRYSVENLSMFYIYIESVFIGLCYICYLNWYNRFLYLYYLPFVKKQASNRFFDKITLMNIVGIVALVVAILNLPLTKLIIINSCLAAVFIWIAYSAIIGFMNLGDNAKDISDHENDEEIIRYYESLPAYIRIKVINEIKEISERKERCKACQKIRERLDRMPKFMSYICKHN